MSADVDPTAALLIIGDEVLSAKVEDQNGPFLVKTLRGAGVRVSELRIIGDVAARITEALRELRGRARYVVTTGGIGPTHDDVTIAAVAAALGRGVARDPTILGLLRAHGGEDDEAHHRLAEVPAGAAVTLVDGVLPLIRADDVFVLPGVPFMVRKLAAAFVPEIAGPPFCTELLWLDVRETTIAAHLSAVQARHPEVAIGSYPVMLAGGWRVKIAIDGRDAEAVRATLAEIRAGLEARWIVDAPPR